MRKKKKAVTGMAFEGFDPGELNKKIEIIRYDRVESLNSRGFAEDTTVQETVVRTCWAKVSDESGSKAMENGTEFSIARRRFLIRYRPVEITTDMLIRYAGKTYSIVRPPNPYGDDGRFMEIWTVRKEKH